MRQILFVGSFKFDDLTFRSMLVPVTITRLRDKSSSLNERLFNTLEKFRFREDWIRT